MARLVCYRRSWVGVRCTIFNCSRHLISHLLCRVLSRCVHLRNLMYRHLTRMPHNLPHWSTPAAVDHRAKRWKDTNLCLNAIIITNSPQKLRLVITNLSGPLLSVCEGQHPIPKCGRTLKPVQLRLTGLCLEVRSRLRSTVKKIPRAVSIHEAIHWNAISQP